MNSMSKQQGTKVTDWARQSRADAARNGPTTRGKAGGSTMAVAPPSTAAPPPAQTADDQQAEKDEAWLRQFDLDSRFGPSSGITRLQRWERAFRLGLAPPPEVPELVQRYGEASEFNKDLFAAGKV